ncbi:hypothetical protein [Pseudomonas sp. SCB32]|uniref:hypothetical protein n=1 Tax=Pseudomonas sp. SCB32 TaxID=2653853 RepID=UPI0012653C67|nr:hypothetical protein [Pseudomonas sp. SCB32]
MHELFKSLKDELDALSAEIYAAIPNDEALNIAHGNWSFPGVNREDLRDYVSGVSGLIADQAGDETNGYDAYLSNSIARIKFIRTNTVGQIWGSGGAAVSALRSTLEILRETLVSEVFESDLKSEAAKSLRKLQREVRAMELRIQDLTPRASQMEEMIKRIEEVHEAAEQFPSDIELLKEDRDKIKKLLGESDTDRVRIKSIRDSADHTDKSLKDSKKDADDIISRCETAYSSATSVGLAAAFHERSIELNSSIWKWVSGLVLALVVGGVAGSIQLHRLTDLAVQPNVSQSMVVLNIFLSIVSVGGPIWFAWLSTKQIGHRFRLSEDYAFKASISRAYEGFRREAAKIDKNMEASLLASALTRFDELPLRLVEQATHGSPWHELLASDLIKDASKTIPGFVEAVKELAKNKLNKAELGGEASVTPISVATQDANHEAERSV